MFKQPQIAEVKPLSLRHKDRPLPPIPSPLPQSARIYALEQENEALRKEIKSLRSHLSISIHQIRRYRLLANAGKAFLADTSKGIRTVQDAILDMKRTERAVEKEWSTYQSEKGHVTNETLENKI